MIKVNGAPINVTKFSDQTSQVWKLPVELFELNEVKVEWNFENEGEFLHLAQLKDLLDSKNIVASLHLDYLPYARQDKAVSNKTTFALNTFSKLINNLKFAGVYALDPHSSVASDTIKYFYPELPTNTVRNVVKMTDTNMLCFPDHGAREKYAKMELHLPVVFGEKVRNQLTGEIENLTLLGNPSGRNVLIVDDICDGGGTFTRLSLELYKAGAKEVNLYVTHGIFSKGLKVLKDAGISRVFTKNGEAFEHQNIISYKPYTENNS